MPWQILAAINEIETDYGRNLSVSSAGAVGWMQFLPSTWKEWGVDANGDGTRGAASSGDKDGAAAGTARPAAATGAGGRHCGGPKLVPRTAAARHRCFRPG